MAGWIERAWVPLACAGLLACASLRGAGQEPGGETDVSAFEKRWLGACGANGRLGECPGMQTCGFELEPPAASDDPDEASTREAAEPPEAAPAPSATPLGCDYEQVCKGASQALEVHRSELLACFGGAASKGWVRIWPAEPAQQSDGLPSSIASCLRRVATGVLQSELVTGLKGLVITRGGPFPIEGRGSLSKEGIRRTIHSHIGEVRACYEAALSVWPSLEGGHAPKFVIAPDGHVSIVVTQRSTFMNPALECCINTALKGWQFAAPGNHGIVVVTYPFVLEQARGPAKARGPTPKRNLAR